MGIIDRLTPVYYQLTAIGIEKIDEDVIATAKMWILNSTGNRLIKHSASTTLTAQEKQVLLGFVNREIAAFEAATGLTEWEE